MKTLIAVALSLMPLPALAQAGPGPNMNFVTPAEIQSLVAKAKTEKRTAGIGTVERITKVGPYEMQVEYRTGPTRPALHLKDAGWAYVVSGTGGYTWAFRIAAALLMCGCLATLGMTRHPIRPQHA